MRELDVLREGEKKERDVGSWSGPQRVKEVQVLSGELGGSVWYGVNSS